MIELELQNLTHIRLGQRAFHAHPAHVSVGKVGDTGAALLEEGPEQHREDHQKQHDRQALALDLVGVDGFADQERDGGDAGDAKQQASGGTELRQHGGGDGEQRTATLGETLQVLLRDQGVAGVGPDKRGADGGGEQGADVYGPFVGDRADERLGEQARVGGMPDIVVDAAAADGDERHDAGDDEGHRHEAVDHQEQEVVLQRDHRHGGGDGATEDEGLGDPRRHDEHREADEHADGSQTETVVPTIGFTDIAAQERRHGRAQVDAHVEDGEPAVATGVAVAIHRAHHGGDVRLEEAVTDDQQGQRQEEHDFDFDGHQQVTAGHEQTAEDDRATGAQESVCEHATEERGHVDQGHVGAVDLVGGVVVVRQEALDHVEREQRPHAVVAEPLPHLCEEERVQARWVAKQGLVAIGRHAVSS